MNSNNSLFYIILFFLCFVLVGCTSTLKQTQSGFLGDYSQLKPSKEYENTKISHSSNFNKEKLAKIQKILLTPFEIWIKQPEGNNKILLNTEQLQKLSLYFYNQLKQKLHSDYLIVDTADKDTLIIRGAFSNIKLSEPELSAADFIPVRLIMNAGNAAYLNTTNQKDVITEVSIEVEFLLGDDSSRVLALTATRQLDLTINENDDGFSAVAAVLDVWVENFVKELAKIRQANK